MDIERRPFEIPGSSDHSYPLPLLLGRFFLRCRSIAVGRPLFPSVSQYHRLGITLKKQGLQVERVEGSEALLVAARAKMVDQGGRVEDGWSQLAHSALAVGATE